jgi:hypothetical protein
MQEQNDSLEYGAGGSKSIEAESMGMYCLVWLQSVKPLKVVYVQDMSIGGLRAAHTFSSASNSTPRVR